ncbi:hypothetical protein GOQ27_16595 [Clostridium sp. D2Q-11]|uniref:Ferrochelatase n=1 Tax=Anaeromonas frigoriresistens TaxID=2683708 RepID=A0A942ZAC6_9FIRM|nr:hypothetical protein [Anaeromonas frigoriresistens]MBS4540099.1 hypothetical protein [Anaeromonas frigoriresistens]
MDENRKYYKYTLIFLIVLSLLMYMCYKDPIENFFILTFMFSVTKLLQFLKEKVYFSIIKSISIFLLVYLLIFIILFINAYNISDKIEESNEKRDKTAVLMVYSGEAPRYSIDKEMRNIILRKQKKDILIYPYRLYKTKQLYKDLGKSDYKKKSIIMYNKLENILKDNYKLYLTYLYDDNYLENEILEILKDGYKKIIVVPMFLVEDDNMINLQERISKLKLYNYDVETKYTETLWSSESLIQSYVNLVQINSENMNKVGINLIGIDKNINNKIDNVDAIKQNIMFRSKIKEKLIQELKIDSSKIKLSWYNNLDPDFISESNELFEYGISEMVCVVVDPQLNELVKIDIYNEIKDQIEFPEGVEGKVIDGFLVDNNLLNEIVSRIEYVYIQNWN